MLTIFRTAALTLGVAAVLTVAPIKSAEAGNGGAVALGVLGGIALGAGIANRGYYRGTPYPAAGAYAAPVYQPPCDWERRQFYDNYRGTYWKRVQVCG